MFIAVNKIEVPAAQRQRMTEAFEKSVPALKQFAGFQGFELWFSDDNTVLSISRWDSKADFETYVNSEMFKRHHGGASREQTEPNANLAYYTGKSFL